jgi:hypothetical protein
MIRARKCCVYIFFPIINNIKDMDQALIIINNLIMEKKQNIAWILP